MLTDAKPAESLFGSHCHRRHSSGVGTSNRLGSHDGPKNEALQVGALSVALFSAKVGKSRTSQNFGMNMFFPLADCPYR